MGDAEERENIGLTKEQALEEAKFLWKRINDGNMAHAITMIADLLQHTVNDACGRTISVERARCATVVRVILEDSIRNEANYYSDYEAAACWADCAAQILVEIQEQVEK